MKTIDYLATIKKTYNENGKPASDYRIAKLLDISPTTISGYRHKKRAFDPDVCLKVADLLQIDPRVIFTDMQIERAKSKDESTIWKSIRDNLSGNVAACIALAAILSPLMLTNPSESMAYLLLVSPELILCKMTIMLIIVLNRPHIDYLSHINGTILPIPHHLNLFHA